MRTGTRAVGEILAHYKFWNEIDKIYLSEQYTHCIGIPVGCENYTIVSNIRNPYSKVLSIWHLGYFSQDQITGKPIIKMSFSEFLLNGLFNPFEEACILSQYRKPDIHIRLENLADDLKKISFIDFNDPRIKEIMGNRIYENAFSADAYDNCNFPTKSEFELTRDPKNILLTDYKSYYKTQQELDIVWHAYENVFKEFGYQREFLCQKT